MRLLSQLVDKNDVALAIVPLNHPLMLHNDLDAEARGLLDRLLGYLHDNHGHSVNEIDGSPTTTRSSLLMAVISALSVLAKARASLALKIVGALIIVLPSDTIALSDTGTKEHLEVRFVAKSVKIVLAHFLKCGSACLC